MMIELHSGKHELPIRSERSGSVHERDAVLRNRREHDFAISLERARGILQRGAALR